MKKNLSINSLMSIAEVVITSLSIFFLYKFVLIKLGVSQLGVWSVVLATTSLAKFGDLGGAAGLSRYIAQEMSLGNAKRGRQFIETALLFNFGLYSVIGCILYVPLFYFMKLLVSAQFVVEARSLLPYTIVSFTLLNINIVTTSSIIGLHKTYIKSLISIIGTFIQIVVAIILLPRYGLAGLAIGQVTQYVFSILTSWLYLNYAFWSGTIWLPLRFTYSAFKELIGFGLKMQGVTIINFLFEPLTKFVLSSIGGVASLGYFEMAYRYAFQIRNVISSPATILIPTFAHNIISDPEENKSLYRKATSLSVVFGGVVMLLAALMTPLVSYLLIGHLSIIFIIFAVSMCLAWYINICTNVVYFYAVSHGKFGGILIGHLVSTFGGAIAAALIGWAFGAVAIGVTIAVFLGLGGVTSMVLNCRTFGLQPLPSVKTMVEESLVVARQYVAKIQKGLRLGQGGVI